MSETIKQRIDRQIKEQLAAMPRDPDHYTRLHVGPTCPLCSGIMRQTGPTAMQCGSCNATVRR